MSAWLPEVSTPPTTGVVVGAWPPLPRGGLSVVQRRHEPPDALDYFPTPPWATRALLEHVLRRRGIVIGPGTKILEPACGEGHMAAVLAETGATVEASDVFPYGFGQVVDFLDPQRKPRAAWDWIITNPPFAKAEAFLEHAWSDAHDGVALLVRSAWLEGQERYERVFCWRPPSIVAQFSGRVPMHKGRWDPEGKTATAYAWLVWLQGEYYGRDPAPLTRLIWIPPCREALTRPEDARRFGAPRPAPLLDAIDAIDAGSGP